MELQRNLRSQRLRRNQMVLLRRQRLKKNLKLKRNQRLKKNRRLKRNQSQKKNQSLRILKHYLKRNLKKNPKRNINTIIITSIIRSMIRKKMRSQRRLLSMKISQRTLKLQLNQLLKFKKLPLNNQKESQSQLNFLRNKLRLKSKRKINLLIRSKFKSQAKPLKSITSTTIQNLSLRFKLDHRHQLKMILEMTSLEESRQKIKKS